MNYGSTAAPHERTSPTRRGRRADRPRPLPQPGGESTHRHEPKIVEVSFALPNALGPALKSAVDEISTLLAYRVTHPRNRDEERAHTKALTAVGALRAAVNKWAKAGEPGYAEAKRHYA